VLSIGANGRLTHAARVWLLVLAGALASPTQAAQAVHSAGTSSARVFFSSAHASATATYSAAAHGSAEKRNAPSAEQIRWPDGTTQLPFEDLEGVTLLEATATGMNGRDTTGAFVLDTGAGFIALDHSLAIRLGIANAPASQEIDFAATPLPRLKLGDLEIAQSQTLTFDAEIIRSVTDRPVLGLIGQQPMNDRALWIDFASKRLALVPATSAGDTASAVSASRHIVGGLVSSNATALPFRIVAGGKVLIQTRIVPRHGAPSGWLTFVFDTGATKCALFTDGARGATTGWGPAIHALETPTLLGKSTASLVRAARVEVRSRVGDAAIRVPDVDVLLVDSPLGRELSRVAGETVSGLLGYSFLRRFRVVCDYPHRVLWFDPVANFHDDRPYEHSHAGIQLERRDGVVHVMSVARPSPAERAGILPGDEVVEVEHVHAAEASLTQLGRLMEGKPGTSLSLTIRRGEQETAYRLKRQRLL